MLSLFSSVRTGLSNLKQLRETPLSFFQSIAERGEVAEIKFGPRRAYLLRSPEHIKLVLQERNTRYGRQTRGYRAMQLALGRGLVTSEGDFWRKQRRTMQPAFHRERIAHFAAIMAKEAAAMLARWQEHAALSERMRPPLDVDAEMMRVTLSIVGKTLFSSDVSSEAEAVRHAVTELQEFISERVRTPFTWPVFVPTAKNRRFRAALSSMDTIIYAKLAERRRGGPDPGDLLSMLMQARDEETGEGMSDAQLRDEAITLFAAGHETTSTALSWTFYLLAQHPEVVKKLRQELDEVLAGRVPTVDELPKLSYTQLVIKESMRVYPPVWMVARNAMEDDEIGGVHIPAGSFVLASPYVTQRLPQYFDDPQRFEPERWTTERTANLHRFAYFPFGGGPHLCIGNNFAMMEAQIILAMVAARYDLQLLPGQRVEPEPLVTLRPKHGLQMKLNERH